MNFIDFFLDLDMDEQTPELCMKAVKEDGMLLGFVGEETPEICLAAVQQNGTALCFVYEELLTSELCLAAVKQNGPL